MTGGAGQHATRPCLVRVRWTGQLAVPPNGLSVRMRHSLPCPAYTWGVCDNTGNKGMLNRFVSALTKLTYNQWLILGAGVVQCALLYLSLDHFASILQQFTGASAKIAYAQAISIDVGLLVCELAAIRMAQAQRSPWTAILYIALASLSSGFANFTAYTSHANEPLHWWFGGAIGGSIPVLILLLGHVIHVLLDMGKGKKASTRTGKSSSKLPSNSTAKAVSSASTPRRRERKAA